MTTFGNISLLDLPMHGFLCSRCTKSGAILSCLDWAMEMSHGTEPVISTFHSELETAVLDVLLRGKCPIVLVLGRKPYKKLPEKLQKAYEENRLVIISISDNQRITKEAAFQCNQYICQHAQDLTFGYISPDSSLQQLYTSNQHKSKLL